MQNEIIDPDRFGVSFSVKQCAKFNQDPVVVLDWLLNKAGFRRLRLMSYWDEVEISQGKYDFNEIDRQIAAVEAVNGKITFCLGVKQPRYPEYHWPKWAWELDRPSRDDALLNFLQVIVERYKEHQSIVTWHLENEALLTGFGEHIDIDRKRLRREYALVKKLDPNRPIVLSTSAAWGIPIIGPIPDIVGFSYYLTRWRDTKYTTTYHFAWIHKLRAFIIKLLWQRKCFIHELQMEPWGPKEIWEMEPSQQDESMGNKQMIKNFINAKSTNLYPIDLWGGEWWYQRAVKYSDTSVVETVQTYTKS